MTVFSKNEEKALLFRISEGDEQAFSTLFYHYLGRLKPFIAKYTSSPSDMKEIMQETFVQLWFHRDKLPEIDNPAAYIFRIAANQYHTQLRKKLTEQKAVNLYCESIETTFETSGNSVQLKQLQQLVRIAVDRLPRRRREVFLLSRQEGLTFREIAELLKISPKTVKNTVFAALHDIRTHIEAAGESAWCGLLLLLWL